MKNKSADYWIRTLKLKKHPEGGYFTEVYRSNEVINVKGLPQRYQSFRNFSTSIYFLLKGNEFSAFHRILSDETWHFYSGCPLRIFLLGPNQTAKELILGSEPENDQVFQFTIPRGWWFAAQPILHDSFSLCGCTVSPGFDFEDFELAQKQLLIQRYPRQSHLIERMCIR